METKIINNDAITFLSECDRYRTIIADPPDNIGLNYGSYNDKMDKRSYFDWLELVIHKALHKCDTFWLSVYHKNLLETCVRVKYVLDTRKAWTVRTVIWRFTFGQYQDNNMPNGYRPILLFESPMSKLNWDSIRVPSVRMELGDKRAAGPRIPDDVWDFPRVVGNHRDRCQWHPTQHPVELYERILKISGGRAVDIFGGSGTILRAGKRLSIPVDYVDIDSDYCTAVQVYT